MIAAAPAQATGGATIDSGIVLPFPLPGEPPGLRPGAGVEHPISALENRMEESHVGTKRNPD
jgi:hypothetical protein